LYFFFFFFSSRRRHTRFSRDWSSDVCSSDLSSVFADYGFQIMLAETRPEKLPVLFTAFDSIAANLREVAISDDELLRARAPLVEIGRASCRERVWREVEAEVSKKRVGRDKTR